MTESSPPTLLSNTSVLVCIPLFVENESKTSIQYFQATLNSRIEKHQGTLSVNETNIPIAYFNEVTSAVNCAINIQETLSTYNTNRNLSEQINVKIGIHIGEIFISENIPQGEIVNVANDIASITPEKMIYLSKEVYNRVRIKLLIQMKSIGLELLPTLNIQKEIYSVDWEKIAINLFESLRKITDDSSRKPISARFIEPRKDQNKLVVFLVFGIIIAIVLYMRYQKWF